MMGRSRRLCRLFFLWLAVALLLIISISSTAHGHSEAAAAVTQGGTGGVGSNDSMMRRTTVGSRPPSCAGRCWWCGGRRCVAVQVPITPRDDNKIHHVHVHGGGVRPTRGGGGASSMSALQRRPAVSSYDDHSNYKPLSWRCKCGGMH